MEKLTKEIAQKLQKEIKGEIRGVGLRSDWEYILHKNGEEGIKKLERKMSQLGIPLRFREIKDMEFYPLSWDTISILAIKDVFGYSDEDLREMGSMAAKFSILLRIFLKYFVSLSLVTKQAPKMWKNYYTIGSLEVAELNEKDGYVRIILKDFNVHPVYCSILPGYFIKIASMVVGKEVESEELQCSFKGAPYHEFKLSWEPDK